MKSMSGLQQIRSAIEALPEDQAAQLLSWMRERDWERWDRQLESDIAAGKLEFLRQEALEEKRRGSLKDL